jgi:hypothetical protein
MNMTDTIPEISLQNDPVRILYGYHYFPSDAYPDTQGMTLAMIKRYIEAGFDVEGFCLTLNPPGPRLDFKGLDARWKRGDPALLKLYERLEEKLAGKDILLNSSGINLHPEFVQKLPVFTVFQCFDDPESSANLSQPVAKAYDLCLVGNIAEVDTYRTWGASQVAWIPMGLQPGFYDPTLTYEQILFGERDIDLFMMIDRTTHWRKARLDKLSEAFPDAHFYGRGWSKGYLSPEQQVQFLRQAKIGPNLHNSTGPINFRTYYLPANGVLQICDNKSHLGKIFELDKEVVGFDTVEECIDLCRYYLAHDRERREIAAAGWKRAVTEYNEIAVFRRTIEIIEAVRNSPHTDRSKNGQAIALNQRSKTKAQRLIYSATSLPRVALRPVLRAVRRHSKHLNQR